MSKEFIKDCPFCGSSDVKMWQSGIAQKAEYVYKCSECDGMTGMKHTVEDALDAWNRRAENE